MDTSATIAGCTADIILPFQNLLSITPLAAAMSLQLSSLHGGSPIVLDDNRHLGCTEVYKSLAALVQVGDCKTLSRTHVRFEACADGSLLIKALGQDPIALRPAAGGPSILLRRSEPHARMSVGDVVCLKPTRGHIAGSAIFDYTLEKVGSSTTAPSCSASTCDEVGSSSALTQRSTHGDSETLERKRPRETDMDECTPCGDPRRPAAGLPLFVSGCRRPCCIRGRQPDSQDEEGSSCANK